MSVESLEWMQRTFYLKDQRKENIYIKMAHSSSDQVKVHRENSHYQSSKLLHFVLNV